MSSWKVIQGALVLSAATAVMSGCPSNDTMMGRPDAAFGTDTGTTALVDAFVPPGTDTGATGVDAGTPTSMCTSSMGMCDLRAQNCPPVSGSPQACVYALPSAMATVPETVCVGIAGAGGGAGATCCALNSCDAGFVCRGAMETMGGSGICEAGNTGTCQPYCCAPSDCGAGQLCTRFSSGTFTGGVCTDIDGCSLVNPQTGCDAGEACFPAMGAATQCLRPGTTAIGATCMFTNECVTGSACFGLTPPGGMTRNLCVEFCSLTASPTTCPSGFMCQTAADLPAGVGLCVQPPA